MILAIWSPVAAWVLTALSLYFALQLFAHLKAVRGRPIELTERALLIRCGIIGDAKICYGQISNTVIWDQALNKEPGSLNLTACAGMTAPNIKIELSAAQTLNGFYGFEKKFRVIYLAVDESEALVTAILNKL